jgi:hypothetical protein
VCHAGCDVEQPNRAIKRGLTQVHVTLRRCQVLMPGQLLMARAGQPFGVGCNRIVQGSSPLMSDCLDVAERLKRSGQAGSDFQSKDFDLVFRGIAALSPVFAKALIDTDNLEDVFAAFEMASLFGALPPFTTEDVHRLSHAMRSVIVRILE